MASHPGPPHPSDHFLLVRARERVCALALAHVREVSRPLPVEGAERAPAYVLGVTVLRGAVVPVVDLGALFGAACEAPARFVSLAIEGRRVALAVDAVLGVRELDPSRLSGLPPLLRGAGDGVVRSLATLDRELCSVLDAGRLLPEGVDLRARGAG